MVSMAAPSIPPPDGAPAPPSHATVMAEPPPEPVEPAATEPARSETDALFALVRRRYGDRLTAEQLAAARVGIEGIVETSRPLRPARPRSSDAPFPPFLPFPAKP